MKVLMSMALILLVTGCAAKKSEPVVVKEIVYPSMPPISYPADPQLQACEWAKPLVMDEWVIKPYEKWQGKPCKDYTEEERNASEEISNEFLSVCMEHPIDNKSNINFGLDDENWNCYRQNMVKIRALLKEYKGRVDQVNKERADWITKNNGKVSAE